MPPIKSIAEVKMRVNMNYIVPILKDLDIFIEIMYYLGVLILQMWIAKYIINLFF